MNQTAPEDFADPLAFELSDEETRIAAARAGFRGALRQRFSLRHVAPLVAFVLLMIFVAILALTGLIPRRPAEAALIVAAIVFMISRLSAHWSLRRAQSGDDGHFAARVAGPTMVTPDATGVTLRSSAGVRRLDFRACSEAEMSGALIYLWSTADAPAVFPARIFSGEQAADEFVTMLRAGIKRCGAERP